jgi:hypothetical protein
VSQAREKARRKADDMFPLRSAAMRETIMSMLPFPVQVVLRNIRSHLARTVKLVETFREKYGNGDFSYRDHDLDSALDFLAICTNDERSRMTIEHILNSTQLENTTEERKE